MGLMSHEHIAQPVEKPVCMLQLLAHRNSPLIRPDRLLILPVLELSPVAVSMSQRKVSGQGESGALLLLLKGRRFQSDDQRGN
jgi:hypothetical protein